MENRKVIILWDHSRLWGVMAWRAMQGLGIECRLAGAKEIAHGALWRKRPAALLAPGGGARQKARALGAAGREEIRRWLADGGRYLGFCGGAGLALTHSEQEDGLGICPWRRLAYADRLRHMLSGHVLALGPDGQLGLPIWWPGKFAAEQMKGGPEALAIYLAPARDLWLADLPLMEIPQSVLKKWLGADSLETALNLPAGQPLVIEGSYGKGRYVLSYAHLETPASPAANAWLARLLAAFGAQPQNNSVPEWRLNAQSLPKTGAGAALCGHLLRFWHMLEMMEKAGFLFRRTHWLFGWHDGMPGMACNHLLACMALFMEMPENAAKNCALERHWPRLSKLSAHFLEQAELFFWNLRLAETVPDHKEDMAAQRNAVFGHPMLGGGMIEQLLLRLEKMIIEAQGDES